MVRVIVVGAAGRMGRTLIKSVVEAEDMELVGAIEWEQCPALGMDAGVCAGLKPCGVKLTADLRPLLKGADVIIDFSTGTVVENATAAVEANVAAVVGTTALGDDKIAALRGLAAKGGRLVQATNMSVGVNLLFHLCDEVAKILGDYDVEIIETHHNQKKDAPSGTAMTLAEVVAAAREVCLKDEIRNGRSGLPGARTPSEIGVHAVRGGDVVGDHTVLFATQGERVELTHKASSRETFTKGALRAARFLQDAKPGLYTMRDVLGFN